MGNESDLESANVFYESCGYRASVQSGDLLLIAEEGSILIGVLRLCNENGFFILRGMQIRRDYRGKGIGKQMLLKLKELLHDKDCYCLPYIYLRKFYGSIGFTQITGENLPDHLQRRLDVYRSNGLNVIAMRRIIPLKEKS